MVTKSRARMMMTGHAIWTGRGQICYPDSCNYIRAHSEFDKVVGTREETGEGDQREDADEAERVSVEGEPKERRKHEYNAARA